MLRSLNRLLNIDKCPYPVNVLRPLNYIIIMSLQKLVTSFILGTSLYASSAPIEWGPALDVSADSDVLVNGNLLEAVNGAYDNFSTNLNVNGVVFVSTGTILDRTSNTDAFTNPAAPNNLNISDGYESCLLYTSPSPRDLSTSRMPSSA